MDKNRQEKIRVALMNALTMTNIPPLDNHADIHERYAVTTVSRALEQLHIHPFKATRLAATLPGCPRLRYAKALKKLHFDK